MVQNCAYNGIDFSSDRERVGEKWLYNYDKQRVVNKILVGSTQTFAFKFDRRLFAAPQLTYFGSQGSKTVAGTLVANSDNIYLIDFEMDTDLGNGVFRLQANIGAYIAFSEYCETVPSYSDELAFVTGKNSTSQYGVMGTHPFAMALNCSRWKSKTYFADKIEYENSFGRKITLSTESNVFDRFTFLELSQYQATTLRWISDMQTFTINGVTYQRVSDWEVISDENTELVDMAADFARADYSEFSSSAGTFSMPDSGQASETPIILDFLNRIKRINYGITLTPKV
jgi:hypothetical protein